MSVEAAVWAGRAAAESLMLATLTWYEPTGGITTGSDGMESPAFTARGTTPGKVQSTVGPDAQTRWVRVGGVDRPVLSGGIHIPVDALPALALGWECVVSDVPDLADPSLLGRRYRVTNVPAKSYATARRLDVVEVS